MSGNLITDHLFRPDTGHDGRPGKCAWLGTCDRPESEHAKSRTPQKPKKATT